MLMHAVSRGHRVHVAAAKAYMRACLEDTDPITVELTMERAVCVRGIVSCGDDGQCIGTMSCCPECT